MSGRDALMSLVVYVALGLIAGFIASKLVGKSGGSRAVNLMVGAVAAFVGGLLFTHQDTGVWELEIYGLVAAALAATVVLFAFQADRWVVDESSAPPEVDETRRPT